MDYGALSPEFNSGRMYAGVGSGSMLTASAAWASLAAELRYAAGSYGSVISGLIGGPWLGPSATAMAAAAAPFVAWLSIIAGQAELTATQIQAAAAAFEAAFAMTVPPWVIAANRAQRMMLVATNLFGQNTPLIAALDAHYGEMWGQDAEAMYSYAAQSAAITAQVTPTAPAPQTTNLSGLAAQGANGGQVVGTSTATGVQSTLSQLVSTVPTTLQSLASPVSSTSATSGLSGILSGLLGGSASTSSGGGGFLGSLTSGGIVSSLLGGYLEMPGWAGMFIGTGALGPVMGTPITNALTATAAPVAGVEGAEAGADVAEGALGSGFAGGVDGFADVGALPGLGQAASLGPLSVPSSWDWAATAPGLLGSAPMLAPAAVPLAGADVGAGLGFPFLFGGLPPAAARAGGASAAEYGLPVAAAVMARPPAAGYPQAPVPPQAPAHSVPAGLSAPPGYRPAIVFVPTNGTPAESTEPKP